MFYHIKNYAPEPGMGQAGFNVLLWPEWRNSVEAHAKELTQKSIDTAIENMHRQWLDGHGYDREFDGEKLYRERDIRVKWGEWGPEHISIPGNACGLDLSDGIWAPPKGKVLLPHNVDSVYQASLLLSVFLFFADTLFLFDGGKGG
jgi:hypothetical protein